MYMERHRKMTVNKQFTIDSNNYENVKTFK